MTVKQITLKELRELVVSNREFKLVDVLDRVNYEREHIQGAINLPLDLIKWRASRLLKKNDMIVVYCASFECQASTHAAEQLMELGYTNVLDYKGGLKEYKSFGLPLEGAEHQQEQESSTCGCDCVF